MKIFYFVGSPKEGFLKNSFSGLTKLEALLLTGKYIPMRAKTARHCIL